MAHTHSYTGSEQTGIKTNGGSYYGIPAPASGWTTGGSSASNTGSNSVSHYHSVTAAGINSNSGGTESRAVNVSMRLWKRTA